MKWQPFVPKARANAQAVINEETGAAVDIILTAAAKTGNEVKLGEVFATHPGHHEYEMQHFLFSHVIVRELEYDEKNAYWHFEIMADRERKNFISAEFIQVKDSQMLVKLTASNNSAAPAEWIVSFFASPNSLCKNTDISDRMISTEGKNFSFAFDSEWYNTPPLDGNTGLHGMLLEWGIKPPAGRFYVNHFCEWSIGPGKTKERWALIGDISEYDISGHVCEFQREFSKLHSPAFQDLGIQPNDKMKHMIKHLANQLRMNRAYPPAVKYSGKPVPMFTPAASWDEEYFWDAGFTAAGLSVFNPEKAKECIEQYIPFSSSTVFPDFHGSLSLVQVSAAWELYQQTGNKNTLKALYDGLHELFTYASGQRPWPSGEHLDETGDGLLSPKGGGTGLDDAPSQVWARGYGVAWARQNHYWCKPFEVNPTGKLLRIASVNMTAFALLSAKLLKQSCSVLGISAPFLYDSYISKAETSLQKFSWDDRTGHFHWTVKLSGEKCPYYDISGITPLFSGTYKSEEQQDVLIDRLMNIYLTEYGLTTVDRNASYYRNGYWCGAVWLPFHWLFWKALLGLGRLAEAKKIALNVVENYLRNYQEFPVCYEKFNRDTGTGCGDFSFSGLASIVLNLWAGYHKPGCISCGFFNIPSEKSVADDLSTFNLRFLSLEKSNSTGILAVLKPDSTYLIETESGTQTLQSDKSGCLQINIPVKENHEYIIKAKIK